jgi:hypothetical protein
VEFATNGLMQTAKIALWLSEHELFANFVI